MALKRLADYVGGSFFKAADHLGDVALLVEPKEIKRQVPNSYQGVEREPRDEVTADVTVFQTAESLRNGQPTTVLKGVTIASKYLAEKCDKIGMGEAFVALVRKISLKTGAQAFVFEVPDSAVENQVAEYYEKREAAADAAMEDMPDF